MFKIDKVYNLYTDPDTSYNNLKDKLKVNNKKEYLDQLCFMKDGSSLLQKLKVMLKSEQSEYDEEHNLKYTNLIELLTSLEIFIKTDRYKDLQEVDSLDKLFLGMIVDSVCYSNDTIGSNFIEKYFIAPKDYTVMNGMEIFSKYGEVSSFSKLYRGKILNIKLKEDLSNPLIIISPETFGLVKDILGKNKFVTNCIKLITNKIVSGSEFIFAKNELISDNKFLGKKFKVVSETDDFLIIDNRGKNVIVLK